MVSGFFSQRIDPARNIDIGQYQSSVAGSVFAPLEMGAALEALAQVLVRREKEVTTGGLTARQVSGG